VVGFVVSVVVGEPSSVALALSVAVVPAFAALLLAFLALA